MQIIFTTQGTWGSLGYGTGYAFARENFCTGMRGYVIARGETARYLGEAGNLDQDLVWKLYNSDERIQAMLDSVSDEARDMIAGYAVGGESTQTGYGVLLSNPHLPWELPLRHFMVRQTLAD